jgi:hypothetical protein
MFCDAFSSRFCWTPQASQVHVRTCTAFSAPPPPQAEHVRAREKSADRDEVAPIPRRYVPENR